MTTTDSPRIRSIDDLRGRRALVLGLARSGVAAARFMSGAGADVTAYDRRPAAELGAAVAELEGRGVRLEPGVDPDAARALIDAADLLVTSPSISSRFPTTDTWLREALVAAERRGVEVVSEVELFLRLTRARIMGVTGTKGKTTTAALAAAMLEGGGLPTALGGNIGTPLVERAVALGPDAWAVVELSELQLPTISRGADVALYTNVGEDHLDRHGSVAAYRAVKALLAELSAPAGRVVLNRDDPGCVALAEKVPAGSINWYAVDDHGDVPLDAALGADGWVVVGGAPLLPAGDIPLPGRHMLSDTLCAALGAHLAGVAPEAVADAIRSFRGVPHRLETVAERGGVRWVNDSQATIPLAAISALDAFDPAPVVIIAGGKHKGLDYGDFADAVARRCRAAVLIGETADELERLLNGRLPVHRAADLEQAVIEAARVARPGDVALLAPAAASFDMFADYADRGDAFRAAVAALGPSA